MIEPGMTREQVAEQLRKQGQAAEAEATRLGALSDASPRDRATEGWLLGMAGANHILAMLLESSSPAEYQAIVTFWYTNNENAIVASMGY